MKKIILSILLFVGTVGSAMALDGVYQSTVAFSSANVLLNGGKGVRVVGIISSSNSISTDFVMFRSTPSYLKNIQLTKITTDYTTASEMFRVNLTTEGAFSSDSTNSLGRFIKFPAPVIFPSGCAWKPSVNTINLINVLWEPLLDDNR